MKISFFNKNPGFIGQKIQEYLQAGNKRLLGTPERALSEAYQAAHRIKNIEREHFNGQKITPELSNYTENVRAYWQVSLNKNLMIIKAKLAEFRISCSLLDISSSTFLEKLSFIDEVTLKYDLEQEINKNGITPVSQPLQMNRDEVNNQSDSSGVDNMKVDPVFKKTGIFPRSIGRTLNRIKADFLPQAEEKFVREFQISRKRTRTAAKFLAMLVLVPILTQSLSKEFLVSPIVERVRGEHVSQLFLNSEMEEEALTELKTFEHKLKFQSLISQAPPLSSEVIEEKVKQKVHTIAEEFREKGNNAISNVFADLLSLIAFAWVIVTSKREIVIVKSFIDDVIYGLSDSAKAFLIILFTDIFVGFHSPHGWEVILEGFAEHLGLPAEKSAISIFIATFPVILDTIFKYWIFRYLSRLSPSALATMKEMNE
ncbi:proton extrusion protein PcxA [Scytonema tolypothrichoides VB-61278]|nr:proton extrusion protein PcxA [Scytonema tolypothrichoides VB-61278]